jgi:metallo-beta-lactamase class B
MSRSDRRAALVALLIALSGCAGDRPPQTGQVSDGEPVQSVRIDEELVARRIAPDAYVVTHEPAYSSNVLVVRMKDGTLVVSSSPFDTGATRSLLGWLRREFSPPRIVAINTHYHLDGAGGNEAYVEGGVETYASDRTQALLAESGASVREQAAAGLTDPVLSARARSTRIVPAGTTFKAEDGLALTIGGESVRVVYPGPAHSPDNVVVHFPDRGVLFGGCMIKAGRSIGNTADADLGHWESAVRSLEPLAPRIVVPGHGPVGGFELLQNTIEVVRSAQGEPSGR